MAYLEKPFHMSRAARVGSRFYYAKFAREHLADLKAAGASPERIAAAQAESDRREREHAEAFFDPAR